MKKFLPLLVLSVVANAALVFVLANRSAHWVDFPSYLDSSGGPAATSATATAAATPAAPAADAISPRTFADLSAGDLSAVVARLRAAGYPVALQRAIIGALITERFADRHKALADLISAHPWWKGNLFGSADGAKITAMRQQLYREEKDMREQLLGPDSTSEYNRALQARASGDLPPAKMSELNRINSDYNELINEIRTGAQGILLPEDRQKLAYLEQEKRADITKLLSPDELLELDMRSSPTAQQLKYQLSAFKPTEDEYRTIFKVAQAYDTQFNGGNFETMSAAQRQMRNAGLQDVSAQIQALLPADRAAEFKQKTDGAYIQTDALVTRLQLPATATSDIVSVQKDFSTRADAIRSDKTITPDERNAQLASLGTQAAARLAPTLGGDTGVSAYKQTGAGNWLNNLQHPPAPPAKKP